MTTELCSRGFKVSITKALSAKNNSHWGKATHGMSFPKPQQEPLNKGVPNYKSTTKPLMTKVLAGAHTVML